MKVYENTNIVAKVVQPFEMSDDVHAVYETGEERDSCLSPIFLNRGEELGYFFSNNEGFHFVYYGTGVDGFGFWVNGKLVELELKHD